MNEFKITDGEITEKFVRKNRWHVRLKYESTRRTMPHANYVWLKGNPIFNDIPKGYVIHHLDLDPLNDDISNLALMAKYHHTAYHWKHKNVETKVSVDETNGLPIKKPIPYPLRKRGIWFLYYRVRLPDGTAKKSRAYNSGQYGKNFKNKEEAEAAIPVLWPGMQWRE